MSHQINYEFQPPISCVSNRVTLQELEIGSYTVANLGNRVLLFARTSENFGIVIYIGPEDQKVKKKDRFYTHFSSNTWYINKENPEINYQCELPPKTSWQGKLISFPHVVDPTAETVARDKIISLLIVQEIGGLKSNETKRIELKVQTTRTTNPKNIMNTRD